jgi:hypothetical protein
MLRPWDDERKDLLGNFHHLFQWETKDIITELASKGLAKIALDKPLGSEKNVRKTMKVFGSNDNFHC